MSETPIYCPKCGMGNHPMNYRCQSCGTVLPQPQPEAAQQPPQPQQPYQQPYGQPYYQDRPAPPFEKPKNGLVGAIIVTVLCGCWPLGLVAIINAAKVDSAWSEGRWDDAVRHAKNAQTFTWVTFGVGLVFSVLYVILMVAAENM